MSLDHSPSSSYLLRLSRPFSRDDLALSPCHRAPRSPVTLVAFPVSRVFFSCSVARRCAVVRTGHFGIRDARRAVVCSVQFAACFWRVFGVSHSSSSQEFDRKYSGRPPFAWFDTKQWPCFVVLDFGSLFLLDFKRTRTPPAEVWFFVNDFTSAPFTWRETRGCLCLIHTKPPPAGFGVGVAWSDANPHPGPLPLLGTARDLRRWLY